MKDKKRFLTTFAGICLAVSLTTSFAGCGSKDDGEVAGSPSQNQGDEEKDSSSTEGKLISAAVLVSILNFSRQPAYFPARSQLIIQTEF